MSLLAAAARWTREGRQKLERVASCEHEQFIRTSCQTVDASNIKQQQQAAMEPSGMLIVQEKPAMVPFGMLIMQEKQLVTSVPSGMLIILLLGVWCSGFWFLYKSSNMSRLEPHRMANI